MQNFNIKIAHRGIRSPLAKENSYAACKNALDANVALEIDVHLTKDNKLVVFHDYSLLRMYQRCNIVECTTYQKLQKISAKKGAKIPLLSDILQLIDGKVPIFIEIKTLKNAKKLCDELIKQLQNYSGKKVVFGFNHRAIRYIKDTANYTVMVSCFRPKLSFGGFVPHAICCSIKGLKRHKKSLENMPVVAWTVRSEKDRVWAEKRGGYLQDIVID